MKSKYKSSKSVAKNQTVPISADDPRVAWNKIGQTKARQGAEIDLIGLDGKSLISGGTKPNNPTGTSGVDNNKSVVGITIPPINNQPPAVYPGGSGPTVIIPTDPGIPTVTWSGENLIVQFEWDYSNDFNKTISQFILEITSDGVTRSTPINSFIPNKTQTSQTLVLTKTLNAQTFGVLRTNIASVCVIAADPLNNVSNSVCAASVPAYVIDLPTPVITVTAINSGYSVAFATPTQESFNAIEIVEYESTSSTEPIGVTYSRSYFGTINPANIISSNLNARWVKARFLTDSGAATPFSAAEKVTPTSTVGVDLTPPNEVSSIGASWSGDDIIIGYVLPETEKATRVQIQLTAPNSLVGYFYRFPDGSGDLQSTIITKKDLFDQFGEHYSSFTGILRSIDTSDNRSSGVSFNVATRANPLLNITPTFNLTPLTNGYSVFATNYASSVGINYMEVYAKHTPWSGDPVNDDYVVYAGANPAVIIDTDYTDVYVKIRYYDDFNNSSLYSVEDIVVPLNAGEITSFENPISFGVNAVIYAGGDYQSGKRTVFKADGIFAYDATANASPTTQIIADASAGTPTFITTQAQIADWLISETKIENTLSGVPNKYTGLSATGDYAFWAGSDTSGGDSSSKFSVTSDGNVVAREITIIGNGGTDPLISAGGLFTVNNDGSFTATSATIAGNITASSGEFTGPVRLNGGSLYALGSGGTESSGIRTIFNSSGIAAYNASGGVAEMLTTPLADGSVFHTTSANLGGWLVDSSKIQKTGISGKGNITLDSVNGYITVSNSNISTSLAGINSPGNDINHSVFWAGGTNPNDINNQFRITLGGKLYAKEADIAGTLSSIGALGTITMDGTQGYLSLKTATDSKLSYLVPRNGNIYLTSPSSSTPWSTGTNIATSGPVNGSYLAAGSSFKDPWNNTSSGIGLYSGTWDYFSTGVSDPFISVTKNTSGTSGVIQLSAGPGLGIILEEGNAGGTDPFSIPTMLIYTAKNDTAPYSPSTTYGAWARFQDKNIRFSVSTNTYIDMAGSTTVGADGTISFRASESRVDVSGTYRPGTVNEDTDLKRSAYAGPSQIILNPNNGVTITGIASQQDTDMQVWYAGYQITPAAGVTYRSYDGSTELVGDGVTTVYANGSYKNAAPLGPRPRQRMIVEDPVTGQMQLGLGIYYKIYGTGSAVPTSNTGFAGDIVIEY